MRRMPPSKILLRREQLLFQSLPLCLTSLYPSLNHPPGLVHHLRWMSTFRLACLRRMAPAHLVLCEEQQTLPSMRSNSTLMRTWLNALAPGIGNKTKCEYRIFQYFHQSSTDGLLSLDSDPEDCLCLHLYCFNTAAYDENPSMYHGDIGSLTNAWPYEQGGLWAIYNPNFKPQDTLLHNPLAPPLMVRHLHSTSLANC